MTTPTPLQFPPPKDRRESIHLNGKEIDPLAFVTVPLIWDGRVIRVQAMAPSKWERSDEPGVMVMPGKGTGEVVWDQHIYVVYDCEQCGQLGWRWAKDLARVLARIQANPRCEPCRHPPKKTAIGELPGMEPQPFEVLKGKA